MTAKGTKIESSEIPPGPSAGFPPILGRHPRALVLGSLPSRKSLEKQQYYGHPQNAFWSVMGAATAIANPLPELVAANDSLVLVCFNGQKARQLFDRLVGADALGRDIELVTMPSTSPAYAAMSVQEKTRRWQEMLSRAFPALIDADLPLTRGK